MLLDEPTSHLDVRHQLEILQVVRRLSRERGLAVLVAIHELSLAAQFCDRLLLLHEGRLMADGTPEAVLTPQALGETFQVDAQVYRDPYTNDLKLSIRSPI